jgi:hypothetical protein
MNQPTTEASTAPRIDDELREYLGAARAAVWERARSPYEPTVRLESGDDGRLGAAVLTTRRPSTAAVKIVELLQTDAAAGRRIVEAVISASLERGDAAVKWELPQGASVPEFANDLGFGPMRPPHASASGTVGIDGLVRWHRPAAHREAPYYAQTTLYTCGAVAGMLATEFVGAGGFGDDDGDRDRELAFWRRASNFPACEPIGLAVTMRESLSSGHRVGVHLDTTEPVLLEGYTGFEHDFRAELQRESRRRAAELGVPVADDRVGVDEIVERLAGGEVALLLIDEAPMHGETGPHWVLAHGVAHDTVLIQDPWISSDDGETWVDAHDLPISPADLDRMIAWGEAGTRGVIFVSSADARARTTA